MIEPWEDPSWLSGAVGSTTDASDGFADAFVSPCAAS